LLAWFSAVRSVARSTAPLASSARWLSSAAPKTPATPTPTAASASKPSPNEHTEEEDESDVKTMAPVTWGSVAFIVVAGGGAVVWFLYTQDKALNTVRVESIGTPDIGGPWSLINDQGKVTSDAGDIQGCVRACVPPAFAIGR
jgi:hypothetical protein